jgi:hypothetical protein
MRKRTRVFSGFPAHAPLGTRLSRALAQEKRASLGVLTCTSGEGGTLTCGFKPSGSGAEEKYVGTIGGRADTLMGKIVLIWAVSGPADMKVTAGMLAQRFVKGGQSTPVPTLVGEQNSSIVLQFETNNSSDAAITHVDLKLAATPA